MDKLYSSKGISKKAITKKIVTIAIYLVLAFASIALANSKTERSEHISVYGQGSTDIHIQENRFPKETQNVLSAFSFFLCLWALIDAFLLAAYRISWTEIDSNSIKGNYMGKSVHYSIADISEVSEYKGHLFVKGSAGKIGLIAANPAEAKEVIETLIYHK